MAFDEKDKPVALQDKLKYFLAVQIPLTAFIAIAIISIYFFESAKKKSLIMASEQQKLKHQQELITSVFKSVVSDLMFLSEHYDLKLYFESGDPKYKDHLRQDWLALCKKKGLYDQIRYIDASGMEIIRINYNNGNPSNVDDKLLQNKANRYYFRDTFLLNSGDVYVSPFDLNIEQNMIEMPRKPMIRFSSPVFDRKGIKRGIVMLNYLGNDLINMLKKRVVELEGLPMLMNSDGHWLLGTEYEKEWGFMYGKDVTFGKDYPDAWKVISTQGAGQFQSAKGLFTFVTIYPLVEGWKSSTGSPHAFEHSKRQQLEAKAFYWKCISFIPHKTLTGANKSLLKGSIILFTSLFFATSIMSLFVVSLIMKRRRTENALREERKLAQRYLDVAGVMIMALDAQGIVTLVNRKGCEILGYERKDIIGKDWFDNYLPERMRVQIKGVFMQLMAGDIEPVEYYENPVLTKNHEEKIIAFHNTVLEDQQGNIIGVIVSGEDITERKMTQESLKLSEEKYKIVADNTYDWEFWVGVILANIFQLKLNDKISLI